MFSCVFVAESGQREMYASPEGRSSRYRLPALLHTHSREGNQVDRKLRRRTAAAALVAAAFTAFGAAPSFADTTTSGDGSTAGGNQAQAPISVPINVCGNSVAILGEAAAQCKDSSATVNDPTGPGDTTTSGDNSTGGGNQAQAPVSAPVNICGNAIAAGGKAASQCDDSDAAVNPPPTQGSTPPGGQSGNNPPPDQGNNPPPAQGNNPPPADNGGGNSGGNSGGGDSSGDQGNNPPPNMVPDQPAAANSGANSGTGNGALSKSDNSADDLPFTGSNTAGLAGAALAALGLGALSVWFARRRQSRAQD